MKLCSTIQLFWSICKLIIGYNRILVLHGTASGAPPVLRQLFLSVPRTMVCSEPTCEIHRNTPSKYRQTKLPRRFFTAMITIIAVSILCHFLHSTKADRSMRRNVLWRNMPGKFLNVYNGLKTASKNVVPSGQHLGKSRKISLNK
jgi:hypothetical protein